MSEAQAKLRSTIQQLHRELESIEQVDEDVQQLLQTAVDDIHQALQHGAESTEESSHISGRLREAAQHFEDSHPTLSGIIGSLIDTLSRMGI
jgi:ABC-type transporter Mla subunit MlaD